MKIDLNELRRKLQLVPHRYDQAHVDIISDFESGVSYLNLECFGSKTNLAYYINITELE